MWSMWSATSKRFFASLHLCAFALNCLTIGSLSAAAAPTALAVPMDCAHPLTIAELIDTALQNNPETKVAWWNAQRAASGLGSARSAYYPKLDFNANARHGRDFKFINGPDTNYTITGADLSLSMLLFDFGERSASVEAAKMALLAANWQTDATLQKVIVSVLENAYAALHAQELLQAALISREDAGKMLDVTHELNRIGLHAISDVYTSEATLAQMKMDVAQYQAAFEIQKSKLAASLGIAPETPLDVATIEQMPSIPKQRTSELIALAGEQRADLMAKRARLSESLSLLDKSHAAHYPKVTFAGRGGGEHAIHDKANASHYQVAVNIEIPLFNGFKTMHQQRIAYADAQISSEELAKLELNIALDILTYSKTLEAAQEMLIYADANLQNSQKAYEGVLDKYRAGAERIAELSNALRQLAAARVRHSDIKTRLLVALANLAYATGSLAPYMEDSCAKQH